MDRRQGSSSAAAILRRLFSSFLVSFFLLYTASSLPTRSASLYDCPGCFRATSQCRRRVSAARAIRTRRRRISNGPTSWKGTVCKHARPNREKLSAFGVPLIFLGLQLLHRCSPLCLSFRSGLLVEPRNRPTVYGLPYFYKGRERKIDGCSAFIFVSVYVFRHAVRKPGTSLLFFRFLAVRI